MKLKGFPGHRPDPFGAALRASSAAADASRRASPTKLGFKLLPAVRSPASPPRTAAGRARAPSPFDERLTLTRARPLTSPANAKLPLVPLVMTADARAPALGSFDDLCNVFKAPKSPLPAVSLHRSHSANAKDDPALRPRTPLCLGAARQALALL